jgi:hypothetical protein
MQRFLRVALALISLTLAGTAGAQAEKRIALLIGNQRYNAKVGPLNNPHSDVLLVGAALKAVGFTVTEVNDADYRSTDAAIKRHIAAVRREGDGAISFVYYSGHGAADPDTKINYLIPVDVANADDEELWNYSINLNTLVENLRAQAPGATHYVVFDACRNELNLTRRGQKALTEKGFVPMAYTPGVMVAYATAPGRTASDTGTGGGTYAKALADEIVKPGVDSMLVFSRVARRVQHEIGQDPFLSASTMPEIYFAGNNTSPAPAALAPPAPTSAPHSNDAAEAWAAAKDTKSIAVLEDFVARYKDTFYAGLARARIEELRRQTTVSVPDGTKNTFQEPRSTRETLRDSLYRTIMERMSHARSRRDPDKSFSEAYQGASRPKAMVVCLDWSKIAPTQLESGAIGGAHSDRGNVGCRGMNSEQCGRYALGRCHERGMCSSKGQECVLVDIDGRNALKLNDAWAKRFTQ